MASEAEEKILFQIAERGLQFQRWRKDPATVWLLEHFREEAQAALQRCGNISPFTEAPKLAEAQTDVRTFETLVLKIERVIQLGLSAERQLEHPDGHPDD